MQMGTPYYMSPEQCRGIGVDHRTDIYAFGVMLHRVLTGAMPFDGESVMDVMMKHITTPPPKLSSFGFPAALDAPIEKMLAKEPNDRPSTLIEAIDAVAKASSVVGFDSLKLPPVSHAPAQAASGMGHTDLGMSSIGPAPKKSSAPVLIVLAALVAVGAAAFFFTRAPSPSPSPSPGSNQPAAATPTPTPSATPTPTPTPTPAPAAATAMVKFDTTPKGAELWDGDKKLGVAPGPFPFDGEREITVKAPGFQPKSVKVTPKDAAISVALAPVPAGAKPKPTGTIHKDLDDPFGK
jgi:serine/threonine-protein kinase